jgi:hypothetical protein
MPVACGGTTSVLTGSDGAILFTPPGTEACLLDFTDFPAGTSITVPGDGDFRLNDAVVFTEEGAAQLDSALTAGTTYYVVAIDYDANPAVMSVAATKGGAPINLNGDGGSGSADSVGTHINLALAEEFAICQVGSVDINFTRGEVDITSLPCLDDAKVGAAKLAGFRTYQAGYAEGSGTLTVRFTRDQTSIANRMIQGTLFTNQTGAKVTIALEAIGDGAGGLNVAESQVITFPVSLLGFSTALTPEDTPTEASINFRLSAPPTELLGLN